MARSVYIHVTGVHCVAWIVYMHVIVSLMGFWTWHVLRPGSRQASQVVSTLEAVRAEPRSEVRMCVCALYVACM